MNQSLTKAEVVEVLGLSKSSVERRAEELAPEGGRYPVANLPAEAQRKWAGEQRRKVIEIAAPNDAQLTLSLTVPVGPNFSAKDQAEMKRRFEAIEPLIAREKFSLLYTQHPRMDQVFQFLAAQAGVKPRTIYTWLAAWQAGGLPALVRRDRIDKGEARVMNDAARELLIRLAIPGKGDAALRVAEMWRVYEEEREWRAIHPDRWTAAAQLPKISSGTFRAWFERVPEMLRCLAREGVEAYKNNEEIISHRDIGAVAPMDYLVMDHRRLDIFCLVRERGGWKLARPWLTAAIDMRTRKWLAWAIVEVPSSDSIACVLKRVFVDYGLPTAVYWDNGRDFTCQWFEGGGRRERRVGRIEDMDLTWRGVLGTLDIRVHHALPYNARAKLIEPNFLRVSNVDRALPEWCGNSPSSRPERFEEMVKDHERWMAGLEACPTFRTIEEIAGLYGAAMRDINERPLEGEGMQKVTPAGRAWMCPNEAWENLIGGVPRRDVPAEVLHMCFAMRKELTVQHGEVSTTIDGRVYHYRMADNSRRLMRLNGQVVALAYDPLDMGEGAVYYGDRFFGLVRCVELRRMGETAFVEDQQDRAATRRQLRKAIQAVHGMAPAPATFEERLSRREEMRSPRAEAVRVAAPAAIAGAVMEAAEAARAEAAPVGAVVVEKVAGVEEQGDDGAFNFFR
jgi:hypothetical protein